MALTNTNTESGIATSSRPTLKSIKICAYDGINIFAAVMLVNIIMIIRIKENISDFFKLFIVYPYYGKESRMKKDFESLKRNLKVKK